MIKLIGRLTILFFLMQFSSTAQSDEVEVQTWTDATSFFHISRRSTLGGDIGMRGVFSARDWNQIYIRPTYRFVLSDNINFGAGLGVFYTSNKSISNVTEYRLFQEVSAKWPRFSAFKIIHRLRYEQRFFNYKERTADEINDGFSARMRYQIALQSKDMNLFNQEIYLRAGIEYFQVNNSNSENFINSSRITTAFGHRISENFRYELNYIFQKSRKYYDDGLKSSEHIIRLRIFRVPKLLSSINQ